MWHRMTLPSKEISYICFLSFADSRMSLATSRIEKQAQRMNMFDKIYVWNEYDLDDEFREKWKHVLLPSVRGFGYWIWKPWAILKVLETMPEGGILLYMDAGSHLNRMAKNYLLKHFSALLDDDLGVKAFPISLIKPKRCLESRWTKGDVFDYFSCRDMEYVVQTPQMEANTILIRKSEKVVDFIKDWYKVFEDNFSLVDDSVSSSPNMADFERGLHDQSVFSVLFKLRGGKAFPQGGTLPYIMTNPVWALRDRGGERKSFAERIKLICKNYTKYFVFKFRSVGSSLLFIKDAITNLLVKSRDK